MCVRRTAPDGRFARRVRSVVWNVAERQSINAAALRQIVVREARSAGRVAAVPSGH